jgi:hypothetical protein
MSGLPDLIGRSRTACPTRRSFILARERTGCQGYL